MADDAPVPTLEEELIDEQFAKLFPNGLPRAAKRAGSAIVSHFPLGPEHLVELAAHAESGDVLGVVAPELKALRHTHFKLAQLLAAGVDESLAAHACNYSPSTVSILKASPAFQQLLSEQTAIVAEVRKDSVQLMADLHLDTLGEIQRRLTETPHEFTVPALTELHKSLADRSGNGPTSNVNTHNTSVALSADDIVRIKAASNGAQPGQLIEGQARVLTSEDRRALDSVDQPAPAIHPEHPSSVGDSQAPGPELRSPGGGMDTPDSAEPAVALPRLDQV
jgi:hypothetical protein